MRLEVLLATVEQKDLEIATRMNAKCDILIANQAPDSFGLRSMATEYGTVEMLTLPGRGVGLNRNLGLMRSSADVCLFSDDDVRYDDNYVDTVLQAFEKHREADIILFNLRGEGGERGASQIRRVQALNRWTALKFAGAPRVAVRRSSVLRANVYFSLLFGGGARYASGEDILFVASCIRKGLRAVAVPSDIGTIKYEDSTWFNGYDEKYFHDKGVFFAHLAPKAALLLSLRFVLKHVALTRSGPGFWRALSLLSAGVREGLGR